MEQNKKTEKKTKKKNLCFHLPDRSYFLGPTGVAIFIAILKKKERKIYSPTNPFFAWQFLTEVYVNVRIANRLH